MMRPLVASFVFALPMVSSLGCTNDVQVGSQTGGSSGSMPASVATTATGTPTTSATGGSTSTGIPPAPPTSKIDLLFMIDNSASMGDKQQVLAASLPSLVSAFVNPRCIDMNGVPSPTQPSSPSDACASGYTREFVPISDLHVGVVTSSLGGHGSDSCDESNPGNDDHGELVSRKDATSANGTVPTWNEEGFLAWDPEKKLSPPGTTNVTTLDQTVQELLTGVGDQGCGFESQLEGWYRFLADPNPYQKIYVDKSSMFATPSGTDQVLLQERSNFLRPDSALLIVMLTDENDCSTKEYGQYWLLNQLETSGMQHYHLPPARSACATNPNDPCCFSCGQPDMGSCTPAAKDPACQTALDDMTDAQSLRCWDTKRRFGIDFLYPTDRYVQALTSPSITDNNGNVVPNPIFSDLDPNDSDTTIRDPSLVLLTTIVGVPWQDIARDPADLSKGYQDATERDANGTWNVILGDIANYGQPTDPLMTESNAPRSGTNPATGAPVVTCGDGPSAGATNPINGCEWTIPNKDDLEYACIFQLPAPRDCSLPENANDCDCDEQDMSNKPLCDATTPTIQTKAKAYPGRRELAVAKGVGSQGVVGSICPAQLTNTAAVDYGDNAVVESMVESIRGRLAKP